MGWTCGSGADQGSTRAARPPRAVSGELQGLGTPWENSRVPYGPKTHQEQHQRFTCTCRYAECHTLGQGPWVSEWVSVCVCLCVFDCAWVHGCLDKMHMAIKECTKLASVLIVTNTMNNFTRFLLWSRVYICKTGLVAPSLAMEDIRFKEDMFSGKEKKNWDQNHFKFPRSQKLFVFYWFIYKTF